MRLGWLVPFALLPVATAQALAEARAQLREDLRAIHFAQSLLGLVLLSDELELTGARYKIDDDDGTTLWAMGLPFYQSSAPFGGGPKLLLEGALGFAEARQHTDDLFGGTSPGNATSLGTRWRTYGVLGGAGLEFPLATELTAASLLDVGLAHIENDTHYGGPGAAAVAALADGIAFNWDALAATYGVAGRLDWRHAIDPQRSLELVGRYDVRWTETVVEDDEAQDFVARSQLVTLHGEYTAPTGLALHGQPVQWQASAAFRAFPEGDLFGVDHYVQFGGALLLPTGDALPLGSGVAFSAAVMLGEDVFGWTIGGRLMF
jgi:hypothetical protein